MGWDGAVLAAGVVSSGLVAGLFYGWSVSVIPGTRRVGDAAYVEAMQRVNRAILNPAFLGPFLATPVVLGAAAVTQLRAGHGTAGGLLAAATTTYALGTIGLTAARNVPLNDALDRFALAGADPAEVAERRRAYERPWNRWHQLRMAASAASFVLAALAAVVDGT